MIAALLLLTGFLTATLLLAALLPGLIALLPGLIALLLLARLLVGILVLAHSIFLQRCRLLNSESASEISRRHNNAP
jgi:hypothetical protein